jgi:hypothetical protein
MQSVLHYILVVHVSITLFLCTVHSVACLWLKMDVHESIFAIREQLAAVQRMLRDLEAQVDAGTSPSSCGKQRKPRPKKRKRPSAESSESSESSESACSENDEVPSTGAWNDTSDVSSDDDAPLARAGSSSKKPSGKPAQVGDVFKTLDGFCIAVDERNTVRWFYTRKELPARYHSKIRDNEIVISDYESITLDTGAKDKVSFVGNVSDSSGFTVGGYTIRADVVFCVEENTLVKIKPVPAQRQGNVAEAVAYAREQLDCTIKFGPPSNKAASDAIVSQLSEQHATVRSCRRARTYTGKCDFCNLRPREITHTWTMRDGTSYNVGPVCTARSKLLKTLVQSFLNDHPVVFLFVILETVDELRATKNA